MENMFDRIVADFDGQLKNLHVIINKVQSGKTFELREKTEIFNSFHLLLAAIFEEFIREMVYETAKTAIRIRSRENILPHKLLNSIFDKIPLKKIIDIDKSKKYTKESFIELTDEITSQIIEFKDFLNSDIIDYSFVDKITNENNMHTSQIDEMFEVCGINNICNRICKNGNILKLFSKYDETEIAAIFAQELDEFMKRRNVITHSYQWAGDVKSQDLVKAIQLFKAIAKDLKIFLKSTDSYQIKN